MEQFQANENFLKCLLAVDEHVRKAIRRTIHKSGTISIFDPYQNNCGPVTDTLPESPEDLYRYFHGIKSTLDTMLSKNQLKQDQYNLLLPENGERTYSENWDVTLLGQVIRKFITLPRNIEVIYKSAADLRNEITHEGFVNLKDVFKFNETKKRLEKILDDLFYNKMDEFRDLMDARLLMDSSLVSILEQQQLTISRLKTKVKNLRKKAEMKMLHKILEDVKHRNGIVYTTIT